MWWKRIRKTVWGAWGVIRHLLSVRTILQWTGWGTKLTALLVAAVLLVWSILDGLPSPIAFLVCLAAFAVCLLVSLLVSTLWKSWRSSAEQNAPEAMVPTDFPAHTQSRPCPQIVIEYAYEDRHPAWPPPQTNNRINAPLVVKNVSTTSAAYNIRLAPLMVEGVTATFQPSLISVIEAGGRTDVSAQIPGEGPLFRGRLPVFLRRSYKDSSMQEYFEDKSFVLTVEYEDGEHPVRSYETQCQLVYRRYNDRIYMGQVKLRLRSSTS